MRSFNSSYNVSLAASSKRCHVYMKHVMSPPYRTGRDND